MENLKYGWKQGLVCLLTNLSQAVVNSHMPAVGQ